MTGESNSRSNGNRRKTRPGRVSSGSSSCGISGAGGEKRDLSSLGTAAINEVAERRSAARKTFGTEYRGVFFMSRMG